MSSDPTRVKLVGDPDSIEGATADEPPARSEDVMPGQPHPRQAATHTDLTERGTPGSRKVLGTAWPRWLLLVLIALGLPRTVLADVGIVAPESSWVYYVLALTPFAVWFALAVFRRTPSPIRDHLVAGALYGLSLIIVHEALWALGSSLGHHPPRSAVALAEQFSPPFRDLVVHGYTSLIAMMIGLGVGLAAAIVAAVANRVRTLRTSARHNPAP
jgi:hypothetical protein